jgi:hypothetical protein
VTKSTEELFDIFADRIAEILRERHELDPRPLLRVHRSQLVVEALVDDTPAHGQRWHRVRATAEELDWTGPDAAAESFVRRYTIALVAAGR